MSRKHEALEQQDPRQGRARQLALFRYILGNAQMFCASIAIVLLVRTGLSANTLATAAVASALTLTSLIVFRLRK